MSRVEIYRHISPDRTVLISGQKIREVGSSRVVLVPKQAHSADARGKYLIPGLWDMHVHSLWNAERPPMFFPLFLANGVTGVREIGGPMPARSGTLARPGRFRRGDWPSPGRPGPFPDFLKVYTGVSRAAYFGIAVEAKKENFPFVGHVPLEVGVDEASRPGKKASSTRPYLKELQASNDPRLKYIPKSVAGGWPKVDARQPTGSQILASRKRLFQKEMEVVGSMHRAGVKLTAGTDTPNP